MQVDSGSVSFLTKMVEADTAGTGSGNELAILQRKLKAALKQAQDLATDNTVPTAAKKQLQQLLQNEIQMLLQRIAQLQLEDKKPSTYVDAVKLENRGGKIVPTLEPHSSSVPVIQPGIDTFV